MPLPVKRSEKAQPGGFSVMLDDEHMRDGYYQLAARAVDDAGNERSTDRTPDGSPASITLPVRLKTKLRAARPTACVAAATTNGARSTAPAREFASDIACVCTVG